MISGGLYRRVVGVSENGVTLTPFDNPTDVETTPGSWYWNEQTGVLYVRATSGTLESKTMLATVRLFLSSSPITLETTPGDFSTAVPYQNWITADLPQVRREVEDLLHGATVIPGGSVRLVNAHYVWYRLAAADGEWNWKNAKAYFYLGGEYRGIFLTRVQYEPIATMLVEDIAPTETSCELFLQPLNRLTQLELPITPFFEDEYPNLGDGVRGTHKWIGYGRATIRPDLSDTTNNGTYTIADAAFQTLFAVHQAWAIDKTTDIWTPLDPGDYVVNLTLCTLVVLNSAFHHHNYIVAVDVTGKPDGLGGAITTYADITRDILQTFIGVKNKELDLAAFTKAKQDSSVSLSLWIKSTRQIASILSTAEVGFPSLGRSTTGTLLQTPDGKWTVRIWDPSGITDIETHIRREDLKVFAARPKLQTVYSGVVVFYGYDHAREQWNTVEVVDPVVEFKTRSRERLQIHTYLTDRDNAISLAQKYQVLAGSVTVEAEFEERGAILATHNAGDKVAVTYSPAPALAGYQEQPFEILSLQIKYAPKVTVTGRLGNLRGLGGRVGKWMGSDASDWTSATEQERVNSGFWSDSDGYASPGDPLSRNRSLWW
jgi:hypothetical protein